MITVLKLPLCLLVTVLIVLDVSYVHSAEPAGMKWIPGGEFLMGCENPSVACCSIDAHESMQDARPIHRVWLDGFWMDETLVTNGQFAKFVEATGYVTVAERAPTREDFPEAPEEHLVAGSVVFTPTRDALSLSNPYQWWRYVAGASWRYPEGPPGAVIGIVMIIINRLLIGEMVL